MKFSYTTEIPTDTLKTGRTYHTPTGSYPSITTILGQTAANFWLQKWKERVGEEEAERVSLEATERGTLVHSYAERHFNGENIFLDLAEEPRDVMLLSKALIRGIETGLKEIWGQEAVLWSDKLKFAGRSDMIGKWKGVPAIIDFKTSKKKKYESQIRDYFLQATGYALAHNEMYQTDIRGIVIVITVEDGTFQVFEKGTLHYIAELQSRIRQFYANKETASWEA